MSEEDEISSKRAKGPLDVSRRALLIGAGSTAALLGLGALRYPGHNPLVRPPGGQDEARLVSACIRCEVLRRRARAASSCLRISRTGCWACARPR